MKIDNDTVEKIAHLARLEVNEIEKKEMADDMSRVLGFMEKLNEVDTTGIEPLVYMTEAANTTREDVVKQEITHEKALKNAPSHDADYFKVAKVIG